MDDLKRKIRHGQVIVDFYADWCGPCHAVAPVLQKLSDATGVQIVKIDIDAERDITEEFGVTSIPTMVYMSDGEEMSRVTGALPLSQLQDRLGLTPSA